MSGLPLHGDFGSIWVYLWISGPDLVSYTFCLPSLFFKYCFLSAPQRPEWDQPLLPVCILAESNIKASVPVPLQNLSSFKTWPSSGRSCKGKAVMHRMMGTVKYIFLLLYTVKSSHNLICTSCYYIHEGCGTAFTLWFMLWIAEEPLLSLSSFCFL